MENVWGKPQKKKKTKALSFLSSSFFLLVTFRKPKVFFLVYQNENFYREKAKIMPFKNQEKWLCPTSENYSCYAPGSNIILWLSNPSSMYKELEGIASCTKCQREQWHTQITRGDSNMHKELKGNWAAVITLVTALSTYCLYSLLMVYFFPILLFYFFSLQFVCISIALVIKKEIVVGIVFNPMTDTMYTAIKGQGAFCNEERMTVSGQEGRYAGAYLGGFGALAPRGRGKKSKCKKREKSIIFGRWESFRSYCSPFSILWEVPMLWFLPSCVIWYIACDMIWYVIQMFSLKGLQSFPRRVSKMDMECAVWVCMLGGWGVWGWV